MGETDRVDTGIVESAKSEDEQSTSGEKLDHSYSKDDGKQIAFLPKVPVFILWTSVCIFNWVCDIDGIKLMKRAQTFEKFVFGKNTCEKYKIVCVI